MSHTRLAAHLYGDLRADREPVYVVDIGCSHTGVGSEWNVFGTALHGIGFDPLEAEIQRLRSIEMRPYVNYEAAFVGLSIPQKIERDAYEATLLPRYRANPDPVGRSSALRAAALQKFDHEKEVYNAGAQVSYAQRHVSLDEYAAETGLRPHIIKIDTDGADLEVLLGAEQVLGTSVIACHVECMFQGAESRYANTFSGIDAFLRKQGFSLFTLDPFRYSRAALPSPFVYDMFAQTRTGQLTWADAVFIRDFAAPDYEVTFGFRATAERVVAAACVMELFGLQDCAAELIQTFAERLPYDTSGLLDQLVPNYFGPGLTYEAYIARFEANPRGLFNSAQTVTVAEPIVGASVRLIDLATCFCDASWGSNGVVTSKGLTVRTGTQPWSYATVLPLPIRDGHGMVELDVQVGEGKVGLAILGTDQNVLSQVWLAASADTRPVLLPIANLANTRGVVLRNGMDDGTTSFATITGGRLVRF